MPDMTSMFRVLCSELVYVFYTNSSSSCVCNLEEIWPEGALLNCELPPCLGDTLLIDAGPAVFRGSVVSVQPDESLGYYVEVAFSAGSEWSSQTFAPSHALEVAFSIQSTESSSQFAA